MPLKLRHLRTLWCPFYFEPSYVGSCPDGWIFYDFTQQCYYIEETGMSARDAEDNCRTMDSYLASIHSQEENDFIQGK